MLPLTLAVPPVPEHPHKNGQYVSSGRMERLLSGH